MSTRSAGVVILATFDPLPTERSHVINELVDIAASVSREPGCLQYDVHLNGDGAPVLVERWKTWADYEIHRTSSPAMPRLTSDVLPRCGRPLDVTRLIRHDQAAVPA